MHVLFALLFVPLCAFIGVGVDYARVLDARSKTQVALDAGTLAGAIHWKRTGELAEAQTMLTNYFRQGVKNNTLATNAILTITKADPTTGKFEATAKVDIPTLFLPLIGIKTFTSVVKAETTAMGRELDMSIVLDTTGSMLGTKLRNLKSAGNDLLDIFEKFMDRGVARVALVPFADAVNLGSSASLYSEWAAGNVGATRNQTSTLGLNTTFKRTTCVTETGANYTVDGSCSPPNVIVPLSTDAPALRSAINGLIAKGSTAGHLGAIWGGKALDPAKAIGGIAPGSFEDVTKGKLMKVAIIMTDGEYNTQYCNGIKDKNSTTLESIERKANCTATKSSTQQSLDACSAMKAQGIEVYVVGFQVATAQKTSLTACATDAKHAYFPYSGESLRTTFQSIGYAVESGLMAARISQ